MPDNKKSEAAAKKQAVQEAYTAWVKEGRPRNLDPYNSNLNMERINSGYNKSRNDHPFILMDRGFTLDEAMKIGTATSDKVGMTDENAARAARLQILQQKKATGQMPWALPGGKLASGWALNKQGQPVRIDNNHLASVLGGINPIGK